MERRGIIRLSQSRKSGHRKRSRHRRPWRSRIPTSVKLTPKDDDAIDYVIVNGAECEPYLTSDYRV